MKLDWMKVEGYMKLKKKPNKERGGDVRHFEPAQKKKKKAPAHETHVTSKALQMTAPAILTEKVFLEGTIDRPLIEWVREGQL